MVIPVSRGRSADMLGAAARLHDELEQAGFEVALDNRGLRPGVMFKDAELLGIPHRLVLSERSLENGMVEYRARTEESSEDVPRDGIVAFMRERLHRVG